MESWKDLGPREGIVLLYKHATMFGAASYLHCSAMTQSVSRHLERQVFYGPPKNAIKHYAIVRMAPVKSEN